jgi:hypothetical protein
VFLYRAVDDLFDIGNSFGTPILGAIHNKRVILQARYVAMWNYLTYGRS